jgi:hypothetical protein
MLYAWYEIVGGAPAHVAILFAAITLFSIRKEVRI